MSPDQSFDISNIIFMQSFNFYYLLIHINYYLHKKIMLIFYYKIENTKNEKLYLKKRILFKKC